MVKVIGDTASGITYVEARYFDRKIGSLDLTAKMTEHYVRTSDGWKIANLLIQPYTSIPADPPFLLPDGRLNNHFRPAKP